MADAGQWVIAATGTIEPPWAGPPLSANVTTMGAGWRVPQDRRRLASRVGFEPTTQGLKVPCSDH